MIESLWSLLGIILYLAVFPLLLGFLLAGKKRQSKWIAMYAYGMLGMMAAFQLACVPLVLLHRSLLEAVILWHVFMGILCAVCFVRKKTALAVWMAKPEKWEKQELLLLAAVLALLAVQCAAYLAGTHIDNDDARYVANAVAAYETNTMYRYHPNNGTVMKYFMGEIGKETTSPMMMFYAAVSLIVRVHPTIMIHTVWAVIWVLVSYAVYWMIAACFYPENRRNRLLFLLFVMLLQIFGNTSIYTSSTFTLTRAWQGKALVPAVVMPFLLALFLRRWKDPAYEWYPGLLLCSLAACLCSGMGVYLSAILTAAVTIAAAVKEKSIKTLILGGCCCIPNVVYTGLYLLVHLVIIR